VQFTVSELPDIRTSTPSVVATVGSSAELNCQFEEMLSNEVQWTKDGHPLNKSNRVRVDEATLSFSPVVVSDSGMYQCWADNDAGSSYAIIRLTVKQAGICLLPNDTFVCVKL
jgi:Immunoglobulin I-set domain